MAQNVIGINYMGHTLKYLTFVDAQQREGIIDDGVLQIKEDAEYYVLQGEIISSCLWAIHM